MIWRVVFELAILVFVPLFAVTQIIVPSWKSKPMFPLFRRKAPIISQLEEARSDVTDAELELDLRRTQKEADKIRRRTV